ncbi:MAG: 30S ribosomal protein S21 [bacterium]|nr:30S ribosomal protein S21 [bacterium]
MAQIEVKRKKGESFDAMLRRWSKRVMQSGKILDARSNLFFERKLSKSKRKGKKLRGQQIAEERSYLIRSGKAKVEDFRQKRRR